MIYYKAICKLHGWESAGHYLTRATAVKSAKAHMASTPGPHDIVILEIYIPKSAIEVRSEKGI